MPTPPSIGDAVRAAHLEHVASVDPWAGEPAEIKEGPVTAPAGTPGRHFLSQWFLTAADLVNAEWLGGLV